MRLRRTALLVTLLLGGCARDLAGGPQVGSLNTGAGLLRWLPDQGGPRNLEPSTREALTDSLLRGEREVAFALRSGQREGLRDLFTEAALEDARAVAASGAAPHSWGHRVTLRFYAPDGATVSLTDQYWYVIPDPESAGALRAARRTQDVVAQLDDGNWRTHHWRVLRDEPMPAPDPPGPAPLTRGVRLGPPDLDRPELDRPELNWTGRRADDWQRDLRAVRDLGLDTLILPLDLRPGAPESSRTAPALAEAGRAALAQGAGLLLEVQVDSLSPRALRALHGALGAGERPDALVGVLLRPEVRPDAAAVTLWRQTLQARFGPLPLGTAQAEPTADFTAGSAVTFRENRWPLGLLHDPRRVWQLRAFVRAHPQGSVQVGRLYGPGGFLTPDGSFTPLARALTRPQSLDRPQSPGPLAFVWGWALDLWPLLACAALLGAWWATRGRREQRRQHQGRQQQGRLAGSGRPRQSGRRRPPRS
ncbi:putative hypothetical protein [Deinococcus grandis]|uniref:Uncharacterized protein n=1 Tax=Deinococcus grandis TaxID=57498 RepID=A0A117DRW2_9DEIO|nr:hypothetical protein [Deinococcus grandis]BBN96676.1 hypothetical protein DEGR_34090 [Deinococcus grandis]GAQ23356.1 putative hypothetical protein [Deinococcus grandis]